MFPREIEDRSTIGVCTVIISVNLKIVKKFVKLTHILWILTATKITINNIYYFYEFCYYSKYRIILISRIFFLHNNLWNTYISWHTASKITNNFSIRIAEQNFICITHIVIVISGISIHIFIHFKGRKSNLPVSCIVCGGLKKKDWIFFSRILYVKCI